MSLLSLISRNRRISNALLGAGAGALGGAIVAPEDYRLHGAIGGGLLGAGAGAYLTKKMTPAEIKGYEDKIIKDEVGRFRGIGKADTLERLGNVGDELSLNQKKISDAHKLLSQAGDPSAPQLAEALDILGQQKGQLRSLINEELQSYSYQGPKHLGILAWRHPSVGMAALGGAAGYIHGGDSKSALIGAGVGAGAGFGANKLMSRGFNPAAVDPKQMGTMVRGALLDEFPGAARALYA